MRQIRGMLRSFVVLVLLLAIALPSGARASSSTTIVKLWVGNNIMAIGGIRQPIDAEGTKPVIVEGRTLVPIRAVIEAFDGSVAWEASTRKVTVSLGENSLDLWIGKSTASLNGTTLPVDAANPRVIPIIMSGRTMLPLRFVSESLGIDVQYEASTKMITLTYMVDATPPPPSAPMLVSPGDGSVIVGEMSRLSWFPVTGTDMARIQILAAGIEIHAKSNLSGTEYAVPAGTLPDGTYTWRVALHNEGGWGTWSNSRMFSLSSAAPPSAPQLLAPVNGSVIDSANVVLMWQSVAGVDSYRIQVLQNAGEVHAASSLNGTAYTVPAGVLASGTYSWQAAAHSSGGWSPWSDAFSFQARAKLTVSDIAKYVDRTVLIEVKGFENGEAFSASGSGFFISGDGRIVTNYHVIDAATQGTVTANGGQKYDIASVLGYNKDQDLAVLQVSGTGYPICTLGDSSKVAVGDSVVAIGSPLGIQNTVSEGIVSKIWDDGDLQITAPISPGSSGGALFNMYGEVIGVTTWKIREGENMNGAVPVNSVRSLDTTLNLTLAQVYQREHGSAPAVPSPPVLLQPSKDALVNAISGKLSWSPVTGADTYTVWIGSGTVPGSDTEVLSKAVTTTTFDLYNASLGLHSTYCWQVAAHNSYGWGDWSEVRVFYVLPKLNPPTLNSPADESTVSVTPTLSWLPVLNATEYGVALGIGRELDVLNITWEMYHIQGTNVTVPSGILKPNTTYWWVALSYGDESRFAGSEAGEVRHFSTAVALQAPTIVSPANDAVLTTLSPTLSWTSVSSATKYEVKVWPDMNNAAYFIDETVYGTSYTIPSGKLVSGSRYGWSVCAGNSSGWSGWATVLISGTTYSPSFTVQAVTLTPPSLFAPTEGYKVWPILESYQMTFTWSSVPGAVTYGLWIGEGLTGAASTVVYTPPPTTSTSYTVSTFSLAAGKTYTWAVEAKDSSGRFVFSADRHFSIVDVDGISTFYPTNYSIISTSPTLMWSPLNGATSYRVDLLQGATYSSATNILSQVVYGTQYTLPGFTLTHGLPYMWIVYAYSGSYLIGCSPWCYFSVSP